MTEPGPAHDGAQSRIGDSSRAAGAAKVPPELQPLVQKNFEEEDERPDADQKKRKKRSQRIEDANEGRGFSWSGIPNRSTNWNNINWNQGSAGDEEAVEEEPEEEEKGGKMMIFLGVGAVIIVICILIPTCVLTTAVEKDIKEVDKDMAEKKSEEKAASSLTQELKKESAKEKAGGAASASGGKEEPAPAEPKSGGSAKGSGSKANRTREMEEELEELEEEREQRRAAAAAAVAAEAKARREEQRTEREERRKEQKRMEEQNVSDQKKKEEERKREREDQENKREAIQESGKQRQAGLGKHKHKHKKSKEKAEKETGEEGELEDNKEEEAASEGGDGKLKAIEAEKTDQLLDENNNKLPQIIEKLLKTHFLNQDKQLRKESSKREAGEAASELSNIIKSILRRKNDDENQVVAKEAKKKLRSRDVVKRLRANDATNRLAEYLDALSKHQADDDDDDDDTDTDTDEDTTTMKPTTKATTKPPTTTTTTTTSAQSTSTTEPAITGKTTTEEVTTGTTTTSTTTTTTTTATTPAPSEASATMSSEMMKKLKKLIEKNKKIPMGKWPLLKKLKKVLAPGRYGGADEESMGWNAGGLMGDANAERSLQNVEMVRAQPVSLAEVRAPSVLMQRGAVGLERPMAGGGVYTGAGGFGAKKELKHRDVSMEKEEKLAKRGEKAIIERGATEKEKAVSKMRAAEKEGVFRKKEAKESNHLMGKESKNKIKESIDSKAKKHEISEITGAKEKDSKVRGAADRKREAVSSHSAFPAASRKREAEMAQEKKRASASDVVAEMEEGAREFERDKKAQVAPEKKGEDMGESGSAKNEDAAKTGVALAPKVAANAETSAAKESASVAAPETVKESSGVAAAPAVQTVANEKTAGREEEAPSREREHEVLRGAENGAGKKKGKETYNEVKGLKRRGQTVEKTGNLLDAKYEDFVADRDIFADAPVNEAQPKRLDQAARKAVDEAVPKRRGKAEKKRAYKKRVGQSHATRAKESLGRFGMMSRGDQWRLNRREGYEKEGLGLNRGDYLREGWVGNNDEMVQETRKGFQNGRNAGWGEVRGALTDESAATGSKDDDAELAEGDPEEAALLKKIKEMIDSSSGAPTD